MMSSLSYDCFIPKLMTVAERLLELVLSVLVKNVHNNDKSISKCEDGNDHLSMYCM